MSTQEKDKVLDKVVIRFSGDSGDGMQLTGTLFSNTVALEGNDLATFPDYPSEIRAPQGTVGGVSGFQVHFGKDIHHSGDTADVLVAMNPAALRANSKMIKPGAIVIYNSDTFDRGLLKKAGYLTDDPFSEDKLESHQLIAAPITTLCREVLKDIHLDNKSVLRTRNMFALGMVFWLYSKSLEYTIKYLKEKFSGDLLTANLRVLDAGFNYAETIEALNSYYVPSNMNEKGTYRNIDGNTATAWGFLAASERSGLPLFLGSYPITPASEILQALSARKDLGVKVIQAEDEIAGICTAIGASFGGYLSLTTTSGPGMALKAEATGLAIITELPLVIVNVQRGGPSTGLPTKSEQGDLMQVLYGRNGESPLVVVAASSPSDCFDYAFMAAKIALEHMVPVVLLTDGYLANGSEPWKIPTVADMPKIHTHLVSEDTTEYFPYKRDEKTLARNWAVPGMPGLEHRLGSLEKDFLTGAVSHNPANHQKMCEIRAEKVARVANSIPELKVIGPQKGDLLVIGWGSTYGHILSAVNILVEDGVEISFAHFNYISPLPKNTLDVFKNFKRFLVCELNLGQFANYLRMKTEGLTFMQFNKIQGLPFTASEIAEKVKSIIA